MRGSQQPGLAWNGEVLHSTHHKGTRGLGLGALLGQGAAPEPAGRELGGARGLRGQRGRWQRDGEPPHRGLRCPQVGELPYRGSGTSCPLPPLLWKKADSAVLGKYCPPKSMATGDLRM